MDFLADIKHDYEETNLILKSKQKKKIRDVKDSSHYRLYDIIKYSKKGILNIKKFTSKMSKLKCQLIKMRIMKQQERNYGHMQFG